MEDKDAESSIFPWSFNDSLFDRRILSGGIHVIAPYGTHLGSIETGVPTGNLAWGEDGSTLFITSNKTVYRLKLGTKGVGF